MSAQDINDDAEAMDIIRRLRERGYTGSVVAQAINRVNMSEVKLTNPQLELLREAENGTTCVMGYKPARRLVELGLAEWRTSGMADILTATPAGRAALAKSRETE